MSGMTCGGERTNESDKRHVYLQQICGACISRKLMTCIQSAPFRHVVARRGAQGNRPPGCGALWKMAQLGKRARATARQAAGGLRQVIPSPCEVRTTTAHYRFARS